MYCSGSFSVDIPFTPPPYLRYESFIGVENWPSFLKT
jgi:hypothetical protein